jgi:hypothetical protein
VTHVQVVHLATGRMAVPGVPRVDRLVADHRRASGTKARTGRESGSCIGQPVRNCGSVGVTPVDVHWPTN